MLDKTLNGAGFTPVKADTALTHQLRLASTLRSSSARPNTLRLTSLPSAFTSQKPSPGGTLPLATRDSDSPSRKSEPKIEDKASVSPADLDISTPKVRSE